MKNKARVIAYYLPQFHPIPENDEWWGKGFTEWTNVGKAKPLYRGHYQPKVPADLGYYNLTMPELREDQARLAKESGIEGFCYWHYWFGNGRELLEKPFREVVKSGKPDFPFCLGWANESWQAKLWNSDGSGNKILIEQTYPGKEDHENHFYSLLDAFKDKRYIRVDSKPVFLIYKPFQFTDIDKFIIQWNELAYNNGINDGFHFVGQANSIAEYSVLKNKGFDSITIAPILRIGHTYTTKSLLQRGVLKYIRKILKKPLVIDYSQAYPHFINEKEDSMIDVIPSIIPNWDHSPRSGIKATVLHNPTSDSFRKHVKQAINVLKKKPDSRKIIFLKSWNEWGEGNYIEPDLKYGRTFINVLKEELESENE